MDAIPAKGKQRELIMDFVRHLIMEPQTPVDYSHRDGNQRDQQVKIVGDYAVTYLGG